MVLSLHSEIFVVPTYSTEFWSGHQALAGFFPPTCDGTVSPSREVEPTARKSKITPSSFVLSRLPPSALNSQPPTINFFGTPPRSPSPSTRLLCRRTLLEEQCASSRSLVPRPCQCCSLGANQTTPPSRISSMGPPSRCAQPKPRCNNQRLTEWMRMPGRAGTRLEANACATDTRRLTRYAGALRRQTAYHSILPMRTPQPLWLPRQISIVIRFASR